MAIDERDPSRAGKNSRSSGAWIPAALAAVCVSGTAVAAPNWMIVDAKQLKEDGLAAHYDQKILAWNKGKSPANAAVMRVDMPFVKAREILSATLNHMGSVREKDETQAWAELPGGWQRVLFANHPELRQEWADQNIRPRLNEALARGAFTQGEITWRMDQAKSSSSAGDLRSLPSLKDKAVPAYSASMTTRYFSTIYKSTLKVEAFDASFLFGQPTTAIFIERTDVVPNRQYISLWDTLTTGKFNILSTNPRTLEHRVVPAVEFLGIVQAFEAAGARIDASDSPVNWVSLPVKPVPVPRFAKPGKVERIAVQRMPWASFGKLPLEIRSAREIFVLPDGDLIVAGDSYDDLALGNYAVLRLHPTGSSWQSEIVWRGDMAGWARLGADGRTLWFPGTPKREGDEAKMYRYAIRERTLESWPLHIENSYPTGLTENWSLDAAQQPFSLLRFGGPDESARLARLDVAKGEAKSGFSNWFGVARSRFVNAKMRLARPLTSKSVWVMDEALAELDAATGRTLRAWQLPIGTDTGINPAPLSFPDANLIAVGFTVMLEGQNKQVVASEDRQMELPVRSRHSGMHVLDLNTGAVRFSILAQQGSLNTAARSACGTWMALGGGSDQANTPVSLVNMRSGKLEYLLDMPAAGGDGLLMLAFAWDGKSLWGISSEGLVRWALPDVKTEAITNNCYPDQVTR